AQDQSADAVRGRDLVVLGLFPPARDERTRLGVLSGIEERLHAAQLGVLRGSRPRREEQGEGGETGAEPASQCVHRAFAARDRASIRISSSSSTRSSSTDADLSSLSARSRSSSPASI